jgi:hypothetical protein
MPYFMAASCFLFFSASFDAVSSAGSGAVGVGDGGGADTAAGAGAGLGDPPPPKHMGAPLLGCHYDIILGNKKSRTRRSNGFG